MGARWAFDRTFQGEIPLPLSRLYTRTHFAKGDRDRHDHAFHLVECCLKLAASAFAGRYRSGGERSPKVDGALGHLALPSLGQWRDMAREAISFLGKRPSGDPWSQAIQERLQAKRQGDQLEGIFEVFARATGFSGRRPERLSLGDLLELLPTYRNAMSDAHGSIKASPGAYIEGATALLELARLLLLEGEADILGGGRLVWSEEVKIGGSGERLVVWMVLTGPAAIRREPIEGERTSEEILPRRLFLELPSGEHITLHPLMVYRPGELVDQIFVLNRARGGRSGAQYLCYETGDFYIPGKADDGAELAGDIDDLLSWVAAGLPAGRTAEAAAGGVPGSGAAAVDELAAESAGAAPAKTFGDFEILEELGRGGMAVVYKARQRSLDRIVALKVLPPAMKKDSVAVSRFQQEVRALARFDHPNVVKIFSSGEAGGTSYYAMEFIDGADLGTVGEELRRIQAEEKDLLKESHFERAVTRAGSSHGAGPGVAGAGLPPPLPHDRAVPPRFPEDRVINFRLATVIRDASRGVHHIHTHGFLHRDLKPQNIMITREGLQPVIMDLGLAKLLGADRSLTQDKTRILGTLRYMAPEQLQQNLLKVDARADVYALGAVLYELSCYRSMLDGDTEERLTAQILLEEPPPPQKANPKLPGDLANIIAKATQKNPRDRYQSALDLAEDLDRFIHGEAPRAKPPTAGSQIRRFLKKHRTELSFGLVILILIAGFFSVSWYLKVSKSRDLRQQGQIHLGRYEEFKDRLELLKKGLKEVEEMRTWEPVWEREEEIADYYRYLSLADEIDQERNLAILYLSNALEIAPAGSVERRIVRKALEQIYYESYSEAQRGIELRSGPDFYRRMILSLKVDTLEGTYERELEGRGIAAFRSDPPGAEVFCFRYEDIEAHLVPIPFSPSLGLQDPSRGLLGKPLLEVDEIRDSEASPFETGDRLVQVGANEVSLLGELAKALAGIATDQRVEVKVLRKGEAVSLSWIPFPKERYDPKLLEKEGTDGTLRPGRVVDVLRQFGFTFSGYPLDVQDGSCVGTTREDAPLAIELPKGSYLFLFRKDGYRETRFPVSMPGEKADETIRLLREEEIPKGFVYIPGGSFPIGGDREAYQPLSLEVKTATVHGFFMKRLEVTREEYLEFLNDPEVLERMDDKGNAELRIDWKSMEWLPPYDKKTMTLIPVSQPIRKSNGKWAYESASISLQYPIYAISAYAAVEYTNWLTRKRGNRFRYRLPTDLEWEWAARGSDLRTFVWGNYPIFSFCQSTKANYSKKGATAAPVGIHPIDTSIFGVKDLAGSVSEFVAGRTMKLYKFTVFRGGNWYSLDDYFFRAATRNGRLPWSPGVDLGIRLVADIMDNEK